MSIILGIDVGGSTTKVVGLKEGHLIGALQVKASDQITSLYGAIGNFLRERGIALGEVSSIALTGVGATYINEPIYGIETHRIDEFFAVGHGALRLSGLEEALAVSMGTGTAFVRAGKDGVRHLGGSGVGGGTVAGLSSLILGKTDLDAIVELAGSGSLENVDLSVRDIISREIPSLSANLTAANFGRIKSAASMHDIALGILNMVFETAGVMAVFALRGDTIRDIVLTGMLTTFPQAEEIFKRFQNLTDLRFTIPRDAVFATALGSAYCVSGSIPQADRHMLRMT